MLSCSLQDLTFTDQNEAQLTEVVATIMWKFLATKDHLDTYLNFLKLVATSQVACNCME